MSFQTEETRRVILQWVDLLKSGKADQFSTLAAPDAVWWVAGLREKIPMAGPHTFAEIEKEAATMFARATSATFTVRGLTVEDDTGVLEISPRLEGPGKGQVYENNALVKFVVRDGKIQGIREYIDFFAIFKYAGVEA